MAFGVVKSMPKAPSGMGMMLKALGVDPNVIMQVAGAVGLIAQKLDAIEKNELKLLAEIAELKAELKSAKRETV